MKVRRSIKHNKSEKAFIIWLSRVAHLCAKKKCNNINLEDLIPFLNARGIDALGEVINNVLFGQSGFDLPRKSQEKVCKIGAPNKESYRQLCFNEVAFEKRAKIAKKNATGITNILDASLPLLLKLFGDQSK